MSWIDEAQRLAAATVLVKEHVDAETARRRAAVCLACDQLIHQKMKCKVCGCFIKIKAWAKVNRSRVRPNGEVTHCPLGKWGDREIADHYRAIDGKPPL